MKSWDKTAVWPVAGTSHDNRHEAETALRKRQSALLSFTTGLWNVPRNHDLEYAAIFWILLMSKGLFCLPNRVYINCWG